MNLWQLKWLNADATFKKWHDRFKCNKLEDYYENKQWATAGGDIGGYQPYIVNLVFSTIEIKLANIIFQNPEFVLAPFPGSADWDLDFAVRTTELKQDALNTQIKRPESVFVDALKLAALDSFFRFAVVEVGYAADWQNPSKTVPITSNDTRKEDNVYIKEDSEAVARLVEDLEVPENERAYHKRILPETFRISSTSSPHLAQCGWCGYDEYISRTILEKTNGIKFKRSKNPSFRTPDVSLDNQKYSEILKKDPSLADGIREGELILVKRVWDNQRKKKMMLDGESFEVMYEGDFERLPFKTLRWHLRTKGWYPIPPVHYWLAPQDAVNQTREMTRNYRSRFIRKFGYIEGMIGGEDPIEEIEKLKSNTDGEYISVKQKEAIFPINNPEVGISILEDHNTARADFNVVSATSAQTRGETTRETATSARIKDNAERIRESAEQMNFSMFINAVGRETLLVLQKNVSRGLWVKRSMDPAEDFMGEVQVNKPYFDWISAQDLDDGYDFTIELNVINATPAQMQQELENFISFLTIVNNFPQIALSPVMIREAAFKSGYRNQRVIAEMQRTALINMLGQVQAASGGEAFNGGGFNQENADKSALQNAAPDPTAEIAAQLSGQLGG